MSRPALSLLCAALLAVGSACTGSDGDDGGDTTGSPSESPSRTASPTSPFTGQEAAQRPVLAVKLDNTASARPHAGLQQADLVYVEQVEGGLSRLMAVYGSRSPDEIGPVRSARESDLELLRQFGRPAFAYSGVRSALRSEVRDAPVRTVTPSKDAGAYTRSPDRAEPYNLFLRAEEALRTAPGASKPRDIGFRFGPAPDGGEKQRRHTVAYPSARFAFEWSSEQARWLVSMDGSPARDDDGARLGAPTVVVQEVRMPPSRYRDVAGSVTPYIRTVGSGQATVLRNGKSYDARWKRPSKEKGTTFTRPGGERMPFAEGPVWVVYTRR